jgi:methionyl-tRNA formyltransferase
MRIIFAGTHDLAVPTLQALIASEHEVVAVYTQPDRPAGRGRQLTMSLVKTEALKHELSVLQPLTLKDPAAQATLIAFKADVLIVVGYGLLLPMPVLQAPRYGCINVHVSLLPRWRGASPIQSAILAGDSKSGVSIMQMDAGMDTGPIFTQAECAIFPDDTSQTLQDRLAQLGAQTLLPVLAQLPQGKLHAHVQDDALACHAPKLTKAQALLDWKLPADQLARCVRAFNPWPMAYFAYQQEQIRVLEALALKEETTELPGTIIQVSKAGLDLATGDGVLRLLRLQCPGGKPLTIAQLLNGKPHLFQAGATI